MNSHMLSRSSRNHPLLAVAAGVLLALCAGPARAQDTDDDGTLPKAGLPGSGGSSGEVANGSVGLAGPQGIDVLDPREARLVFTSLVGPLTVDDEVPAEGATFVSSEPYAYAISDTQAMVQGSGLLTLQPGLDIEFVAAEDAISQGALLVVHAADASLGEVLSGQQPFALAVALGSLPALDLGVAQNAVARHAQALAGLHVSVVFVSFDQDGQPHLGAVRLDPEVAVLEIAVD